MVSIRDRLGRIVYRELGRMDKGEISSSPDSIAPCELVFTSEPRLVGGLRLASAVLPASLLAAVLVLLTTERSQLADSGTVGARG